MGNQRRSREEWSRHVEAWKASGLSSSAYAAEAGVNDFTLRSWSSRLRREKKPSPKARQRAAELSLVEVTSTAAETGPASPFALELQLGSITIRLMRDFDDETLSRALWVLESRR